MQNKYLDCHHQENMNQRGLYHQILMHAMATLVSHQIPQPQYTITMSPTQRHLLLVATGEFTSREMTFIPLPLTTMSVTGLMLMGDW